MKDTFITFPLLMIVFYCLFYSYIHWHSFLVGVHVDGSGNCPSLGSVSMNDWLVGRFSVLLLKLYACLCSIKDANKIVNFIFINQPIVWTVLTVFNTTTFFICLPVFLVIYYKLVKSRTIWTQYNWYRNSWLTI